MSHNMLWGKGKRAGWRALSDTGEAFSWASATHETQRQIPIPPGGQYARALLFAFCNLALLHQTKARLREAYLFSCLAVRGT